MAADEVNPTEEMNRILESARRLGVELNEQEATQWLVAISAAGSESDITYDEADGIFGHRITLLDFSPQRLAYFRKIGKLVEFSDEPGVVETAL
ncbi:MAG TPA: hypothetical protein VN363_01855, partial [Anaerolineales bacterium]|nr:hypothetical protein [Anaerolineales bacterium]